MEAWLGRGLAGSCLVVLSGSALSERWPGRAQGGAWPGMVLVEAWQGVVQVRVDCKKRCMRVEESVAEGRGYDSAGQAFG